MEAEPVLVERRAGYRVITLNRPQRLNAFTEPMHQALKRAVAEAEATTTAGPCCSPAPAAHSAPART